MLDAKLWLFLAIVAALAAAIPFGVRRARKDARDRVEKAFGSLAEAGVAIEDAVDAHGRRWVRAWGPLPHPVALDLRVGRRGALASRLASVATGGLDPRFAESFRIRSRAPELARRVLSPEIQGRLVELGRVELRLGSFDSLLPPEYRPVDESKADARLRRLWMIRAPARRRGVSRDALAEVGRLLARSAVAHCPPPATPDLTAYRTGRPDGQWY